jgi:coenzyme F420 hydrogenase subunit beta
VRFRGANGAEHERTLSYEESWGFLTKYKQWRCRICPDHTGEFADLAVGDPWYRPVEPGEPGTSLIVARTPRGRALLHAAAEARYVVLERSDPGLLPASQVNLLAGRGAVWGRLLGMALCGLPRPRYVGFSMYQYWRSELPLQEKLRSTLGTLRRIWTRRLYRRHPVAAVAPAAEVQPVSADVEHVRV